MSRTNANIINKTTRLKIVFGLIFVCIFSTSSFAQLTITKNRDLSFGSFAVPASGGTVTVQSTQAENRTASAGVILIANAPGQSAEFTISASGGGKARNITNYNINITIQPRLTPGTQTVSLQLLSPISPTSPPSPPYTLTNNSSKVIYIGGTLTMGSPFSANPAGTYVGEFTISVIYNQN